MSIEIFSTNRPRSCPGIREHDVLGPHHQEGGVGGDGGWGWRVPHTGHRTFTGTRLGETYRLTSRLDTRLNKGTDSRTKGEQSSLTDQSEWGHVVNIVE